MFLRVSVGTDLIFASFYRSASNITMNFADITPDLLQKTLAETSLPRRACRDELIETDGLVETDELVQKSLPRQTACRDNRAAKIATTKNTTTARTPITTRTARTARTAKLSKLPEVPELSELPELQELQELQALQELQEHFYSSCRLCMSK